MSLSVYSDFIDVLWRKADQGHTSTSPFPSSWLRVTLGFKPDFLQDNFSLRVLHQPLLSFFLPYFRISSKYRQRRLIPRLSVSHSHTASQVYARLMRHIACAGNKNEKGKRKEANGAYLQVSLKANHKFWGEKLRRGRKSQFQAKGASGSLKMDPHPLLMPLITMSVQAPAWTACREGRRDLYKSALSQYIVCIFPSSGAGRGVPLWCQRRGHHSLITSKTVVQRGVWHLVDDV